MSLPPGLAPPAKRAKKEEIQCPYLDTINRHLLDFDFEKVCSQSLSTQNVYSCLVCGKFFQGRGPKTHAYTHATLCGHHMFAHLDTCKIYCLPDNYEVVDSSLDDVIRCLRPSFTPERIEQLDKVATLARDVHGVAYLPGFCGLNNLKKTDYINVVVHQLAHVRPLRDFFLDPRNYKDRPSPLVREFGALLRKIWSRDNFKSVVSPHELVQEVTRASKLRFKIGTSADAADFLVRCGVRMSTSRRWRFTRRRCHDAIDAKPRAGLAPQPAPPRFGRDQATRFLNHPRRLPRFYSRRNAIEEDAPHKTRRGRRGCDRDVRRKCGMEARRKGFELSLPHARRAADALVQRHAGGQHRAANSALRRADQVQRCQVDGHGARGRPKS